MEQRNNLVLQGTETFSRGQLDNVAREKGGVVLDSAAGRYLPYGSYTTPEFEVPAFCNLNVIWNAYAPHNTVVEVRCRDHAGNAWTGWIHENIQLDHNVKAKGTLHLSKFPAIYTHHEQLVLILVPSHMHKAQTY